MEYPIYFLTKGLQICRRRVDVFSADGSPRYLVNPNSPDNTYSFQGCMEDVRERGHVPIYESTMCKKGCFGSGFKEFPRDSNKYSICSGCGGTGLKVEAKIQLQQQNQKMREALEKIIDMNRTEALHRYGDPDKAENWACVKVARESLAN